MSSEPPPTLAGWLQLHGLSAQTCQVLLGLTPPLLPPPVSAPDAAIPDGPALWSLIADCLAAELPTLDSDIRKTAGQTLVNFAPDPERHPRPFTLHAPVQSRVYVSCPLTGQADDVLTVSHEFGHALQLTCCPETALTPVLRETCAFLAEAIVAKALNQHDVALSGSVRAVYERRAATDLGPVARRLRAALDRPETPYDDHWNYPPARQIARHLIDGEAPCDTWLLTEIFKGKTLLPTLVSLLCGMTR